MDVEVEFVPRLEYGLAVPRVLRDDGVVHTLGGPEQLFLTGADELELAESKATGAISLRDGGRHAFVVRRAAQLHGEPPPPLDAEAALAATIASWQSWSEMHTGYDGPYADAVHRSALILQGLTYQPTGAVVAAPTTSLPEIAGGAANWDYRFGWLRDAALVARALLAATCADEARRYFEWMALAAVSCRESSHVQIVFGVGGERYLEEAVLDHLDGYRGASPVRIGNAAWSQRQLDVLGELFDVAWSLLATGEAEPWDPFTTDFLCQLADRAAKHWGDPDAGLWEVRDELRHHLASKLMCWVALDRAVRMAAHLGDGADIETWTRERDAVREAILTKGWSETAGSYTASFGDDRLDASVLLMPLFGFLDATDDRMYATLAAVEQGLGDEGLLRRNLDAEGEGAFLLTSFWLASCRALAGETRRAREIFERAAGCANDLGLLSEMAEPATSEALGNVPQALSHVGLITAAKTIGDAEAADRPIGRQEPADAVAS